DLNELRAQAVFLALRGDERQREAGSDDGDVMAQLEQPRDGTDVILMAVGDHEGLHAGQVGTDRSTVRRTRTTAGSAEEGNSTPQSTMSRRLLYSNTVMLRPISEMPPSA